MRISDFSIQNPIKVTVGVLLIWIFGLLALWQIPIQLTPEVTRPIITVRTRWTGNEPQNIEKDIIEKQEEQLRRIAGMTVMRSECTKGEGEITMEFAVGTNIDSAMLEVSNMLNQVEDYPMDADEPVMRKVSSSSSSIAYFSLMATPPERAQILAFLEAHPGLKPYFEKVLASDPIDVAVIYALAREHPEVQELIRDDPQPLNMRHYVEEKLAAVLDKIEGVADVDVYGGSEDEMRIIVDPVRLAAHRISVPQLREALTGENRDTSGGDIWEGKSAYEINTIGRFDSPDMVQNVVVGQRDGTPVYVRDIAEVKLQSSKTLGVGHQRGVNMITLAVKREEDANVLDVMQQVTAQVDELNQDLRHLRLHLFQSYDETVYIESSIALVRQNILIGGLLATGVLLLFLRHARSTLIVALAIPISIIGSFLVIRGLGRTINVISLAGMSFAVGMVVDAAIVVLENIFSHYERGENAKTAASRGTSEVWGAILASTLTTLAVFIPVIYIQQEAGQLFRDLAIAISAGVALSMLVSLTVIPCAASRLLRDQRKGSPLGQEPLLGQGSLQGAEARAPLPANQKRPSFIARWGASFNQGVVSLTERLQAGDIGPFLLTFAILLFACGAVGLVPWKVESGVDGSDSWMLNPAGLIAAVVAVALFLPLAWRARRLAFVLAMIMFAVGASYKMMPPAEYLPEGNKNLIFANLKPPPGYNIDHLVGLGEQVEENLRPYWEATPGSPEAEALDGPVIVNFFLVARRGSVFMGARADDPNRAKELIPIMEKATSGLPGVLSFVNQSSLFERNLTGGRTIDVEITGPDLNELIRMGFEIRSGIQELYPETTGTTVQAIPSLDMGSPRVNIVPNREKAAERKIDGDDLGYTINALVDGAYAGPYWHNGDEIDLVIYGDDSYWTHTHDIGQLPIVTPDGELIRVSDVATVTHGSGPVQISRIDGKKAITIQMRPGKDVPLEDAIEKIERDVVDPMLQRGDLGGLYQAKIAGTTDDLRQMQAALSGSMILALVITYLLIAALYESFLFPLVIMISVPMAAVGGFAGLRLLNLFTAQRFDTLTMLGFIILIGTVVNNAILIVNQALVLIRSEGMEHRSAVTESVRGRIRPIYMSTLTTVLGMLPLVLFPGAGSELYRGLGSVILGGLLVSTVFTLFLVPMLFSLSFEMRDRILKRPLASNAPIETPSEPEMVSAS